MPVYQRGTCDADVAGLGGNRKSTRVFFGYLLRYEREIGSFERQKLSFMEVLEMRKKRKTGSGSLEPSSEYDMR